MKPPSSLRRRVRLCRTLLGALSLCTTAGRAEPEAAPRTVLTTAAEVRTLSAAQAQQEAPVRITGVFMGEADPPGIAFVVQDRTEGIYVQGPPHLVAGLKRGDLLQIDGTADPGGFAPYVVASQIQVVGRAEIPRPTPVAVDELNTGKMDARWIEITGVVRSAQPTSVSDTAPPPPGTRFAAPAGSTGRRTNAKVKMKLASGTSQVVVEINGSFDPAQLVDAEVRVSGLCFNLHNRNRQFVRPFVQVPRGVEIAIEKAPPANPYDVPVQPVASLLQFDHLTGRHAHRVHVRGTVIHHVPGFALWVRDGDRSLRIDAPQNEALQPGDAVDALGFPGLDDYTAVLRDAVFRKRGSGAPAAPKTVADILEAVRHDADLVELDARLTDVRRLADDVVLTLDWHGTPVRAHLPLADGAAVPARWKAGSFVRIAGICSVITNEASPLGGLWEPRSFQLLLRSAADVCILAPAPWWSAERAVYVLAGFLALVLAATGALMLASRRRLKEQEHRRAMAETEFTAILSERNRVAREIHDTLSQSLGAISVQLELARAHAVEISTPARHHLASAHKLTRAALADARESIWNMRSQVLEQHDLADALKDILQQLTEGTSMAPQFTVAGERRRLSPIVENNLLRIGQEAITNATKHAKPNRIDVSLTFERRSVRLTVCDDGIGFDPAAAPAPERRSFGLVGMEERAKLIGGTISVVSACGEGTRIVVSSAS
jgi:signal transduction histidine kinase